MLSLNNRIEWAQTRAIQTFYLPSFIVIIYLSIFPDKLIPDIVIKTYENEYHIAHACMPIHDAHAYVYAYNKHTHTSDRTLNFDADMEKAFSRLFNKFIHNQSPWNTFLSRFYCIRQTRAFDSFHSETF